MFIHTYILYFALCKNKYLQSVISLRGIVHKQKENVRLNSAYGPQFTYCSQVPRFSLVEVTVWSLPSQF